MSAKVKSLTKYLKRRKAMKEVSLQGFGLPQETNSVQPVLPLQPAQPVAPVAPVMSTAEILEAIAPAMFSYHTNIEDVKNSTKPQQLFMGYDGIGVRKIVTFNGNKIVLVDKSENAPGLKPITPSIEVTIANKIPYAILREILASFKAVYDRDQTEAAAQIYRKSTGEYFVYYPVQENTAAHTSYEGDLNAAVDLRTQHTLVMEVHSHAGMGAFFSGEDNANEKYPLEYCVFGNFNTESVSFAGRVKMLSLEQPFLPADLFEIPEEVTDPLSLSNLPAANVHILKNAKPKVYTYVAADWDEKEWAKKYGYGRGYDGYDGYGGYGGYGDDGYGGYGGYGYGGYGGYGYNYGRKKAATLHKVKPNFAWLINQATTEELIQIVDLAAKKLEHRKDK